MKAMTLVGIGNNYTSTATDDCLDSASTTSSSSVEHLVFFSLISVLGT